MILRGKAWKFGDDISTDHIQPGRYFHLRSDLPELAKHVLEGARHDFPTRFALGDFVIAGRNFGIGSSREYAPRMIKLAGLGAVLARSFGRIFFRNAINIGLPLVICDTNPIVEGDELEIDLRGGRVSNITRNAVIASSPLPPVMVRILNDGGLLNHIKKHGDFDLE